MTMNASNNDYWVWGVSLKAQKNIQRTGKPSELANPASWAGTKRCSSSGCGMVA